MITLEKLLTMPALRDMKLLASRSGLNKEVRAVSVMDAPDSYKWLRGGELLLTSGYLLGNDPDLLAYLINKLVEAGSSALAIKQGRFMSTIPEYVLQFAERHQFPIIEIPNRFVWSDIIAVFYELFYGIPENSHIQIDPEHVEQICEAGRFGPIALMDKLTELFRVPLAVLLDNKQILADNRLPGAALIESALINSPALPECLGNEVMRVDKYYLTVCLIPFAHHGHKEYMAVMSQSLNFIIEIKKLFHFVESLLEKETSVADRQGAVYRKIILDLMADRLSREELNGLEQFRGVAEKRYNGILIIKSGDTRQTYFQLNKFFKSPLLESLGKVSAHMAENAANQEAVVMLELYIKEKDEADVCIQWQSSLFEKMEYYMQEKNEGYVSMGRFSNSVWDIQTSYREARSALAIGRLLWEDRRCFLNAMVSVYSILHQYGLSYLDLAYMHRLDNHQGGLSFDGIKTLEAYIECGGFKKASAKLYIHENTLRYRIQKIGDFLYLNLADPIITQSLLTQVKLWKLVKEMGEAEVSGG